MNKRSRLAALVGTGLLTFAMVGAVSAVAPTYTISTSKVADPATVPSGGASVTFTVSVTNTGTGDFAEVTIDDVFAGCTLAGDHPTGPSDKLGSGETWTWSCTVAGVHSGATNTATVTACHNGGACGNGDAQSATSVSSVTVGAAGSGPGSSGQPSTDMLAPTSDTGSSNAAWLIIAALGVLLGSLVVLSPARIGRRR